jgi:hypothetical protein
MKTADLPPLINNLTKSNGELGRAWRATGTDPEIMSMSKTTMILMESILKSLVPAFHF